MPEDRRMAVLRAIVEDYVATREPVGSKTLTERRQLGVSPATIRNDMAVLEDEGYITQPHTSAGRIPTDAGYRLFVDRLSTVRPLSPAERRAFTQLLEGADDLDDLVNRTVHALALLTRQVAMVQYPSLSRSALRHAEFIALENDRVLVILIMETGRVEQRVIDVHDGGPSLSHESLARFRARLLELAQGRLLSDYEAALSPLLGEFEPSSRPALSRLLATVTDALREGGGERVVLAGTSNLADAVLDFDGSIGPVLEAIEEQVVMLRLLGEMSGGSEEVALRIGRENTHEGLSEASLVTAGYGSGRAVARLGVLGPTRMDYPSSIAAVRAIARYLSRILAS
ncbi:MAG: heat-inducible transcriptional repressor HrcA [Micrococcales bacterium]|nr:heat-inducible transcriptional repressor HrcA [Micrococcales bacterium]